jgi:hypothetical protein
LSVLWVLTAAWVLKVRDARGRPFRQSAGMVEVIRIPEVATLAFQQAILDFVG